MLSNRILQINNRGSFLLKYNQSNWYGFKPNWGVNNVKPNEFICHYQLFHRRLAIFSSLLFLNRSLTLIKALLEHLVLKKKKTRQYII